jgi:hypothetical protein
VECRAHGAMQRIARTLIISPRCHSHGERCSIHHEGCGIHHQTHLHDPLCCGITVSHNLISYHSGREHHQAEASAIVTSFGEPGLICQHLRHPCSSTPSTTAAGSWGHPPTAAGRACGRSMSLWTLLQVTGMSRERFQHAAAPHQALCCSTGHPHAGQWRCHPKQRPFPGKV